MLSPADVLALQPVVGNAALAAMLAPSRGAVVAVQRNGTPAKPWGKAAASSGGKQVGAILSLGGSAAGRIAVKDPNDKTIAGHTFGDQRLPISNQASYGGTAAAAGWRGVGHRAVGGGRGQQRHGGPRSSA